MKILKNYILQEWFSAFLLSILIISFVLLTGNIVKLVELIIAKGVDTTQVLKLFIFLLPSLLIFSIPISILTATLLTFSRMAYDNEISTICASGISLYPIINTLLITGLMFSLICLQFNNSIIPYSHYKMRCILQEIGKTNPNAYLEEKTFIKAFKGYIIFIYKIKNDCLHDIRIYQPQENKPTRTIIAKTGKFIWLPEKNVLKLNLKNGTADEPSFNGPDIFFKLNFKNYRIMLALNDKQNSEKLDKKISDMNINELKKEIKKMQSMGIDTHPLLIGLYRKFSLSLSSLLFILIGIPLSIKIRRRERSIGFGLSLIICLCYYLLMAAGENLALRNLINPMFGVWMPNIILLITGVFLTIKVVEN